MQLNAWRHVFHERMCGRWQALPGLLGMALCKGLRLHPLQRLLLWVFCNWVLTEQNCFSQGMEKQFFFLRFDPVGCWENRQTRFLGLQMEPKPDRIASGNRQLLCKKNASGARAECAWSSFFNSKRTSCLEALHAVAGSSKNATN